jgi:uncharacterized protein DUF4325
MTQMISLANRFGPVLAGRPQAKTLREQIEQELDAGETVVVDLQGVITMSPSFADELFGKLPAETGSGRVKFEHLSEHLESVAHAVAAARSTDK